MELVNRVAESDIDVFDLAALWDAADVAELDLAPWLHRGLVLREKDFRAAVAAHAWEAFAGRHVAVHCSIDAIVPTWAWMLVATRLEGVAASVAFGREADARRDFYVRALAAFDFERYRDRIVVVKGCGARDVPVSAYVDATQRLLRVARKVMYGEPCSSVPLWRRPKAEAARLDDAHAGAEPAVAARLSAPALPALPPRG